MANLNTQKPFPLSSSGKMGIIVLPNPADEYLSICCARGMDEGLTVRLYDLQGKLVKKEFLWESENISLSGLPPGMYFLKVENQAGVNILQERLLKL